MQTTDLTHDIPLPLYIDSMLCSALLKFTRVTITAGIRIEPYLMLLACDDAGKPGPEIVRILCQEQVRLALQSL